MARHRTFEVRESERELSALAAKSDKRRDLRLAQMLLVMQQSPDMTLAEIAETIGCPLPTVKRLWKSYCASGLESLAAGAANPATEARTPPAATQKSRATPTPGVTKGSTTTGGDKPPRWHARKGVTLPDSRRSDIERLVAFLNTLPIDGDFSLWSTAFRTSLVELLGDVDRVSVSVNLRCNLNSPDDYSPNMV